jgi:hypothetical protein
MSLKSFRRTVTGAALGLAMMLGITVATAQAQYRDYDYRGGQYNNQERWSKERTRDYAFKLGYHQGYSETRDAFEWGNRRSVRDMSGYHNDTNGYLGWMGYRDDYRNAYRKGFEQAFNDFRSGRERRYGRNDVERALGDRLKDVYIDDRGYEDPRGRRDDYRNYDDRSYGGRGDVYGMAQQNGYRDGLRQGEDDRQHRRNFDYERQSRYRDALSGYRSEYGDRDRYRDAYRDGFRRGYSEGFRRGDNNRGRWPF